MGGGTVLEQHMADVPSPHILVVIPTRNRAADLGRCLESLTAVAYPSWELLIVDQSDGDATQRLVGAYRERLPKLTYGRMRGCGACRARNEGLRRAGRGIVAYLDDDCTVGAEWLALVAAAFGHHPSAPLIFGSVHAARRNSRHATTPVVVYAEERTVAGQFTHAELGMGASMYVWPARSSVSHLFDVHLGPGTRWPAAEEGDYACRLILAGEPVVLTPSIRVVHYGARSLRDGTAGRLFRGYALAFGAMDMKMIRCGDWGSIRRSRDQLRRYALDVLSALARGRRPLGLGSLAMYVRGLAESFLLPVDRKRYLYARRARLSAK